MKRYRILVAALVMQMCLGATYSWSVFVQPLRALTGFMQGTVQIPFTLFYLAFPATMVIAGGLLPAIGPRRCAVTGGLVFGCGWLLAGFGWVHFGFTIVGIGLLAGIGVGFAYIVPIATCIRWFPDHKGLVTGIAVAGFGGGAAAVSQIGGYLMAGPGLSPFSTFVVFGAAFAVLVTLAGAVMEYPPDTEADRGGQLPSGEIVGARSFRVMYIAMFTGLAAGFTVNANLKDLYAAVPVQTGVAAVSLFALANAAGRITWGWLFDRLSSQTAIIANLLLQAAVIAAAGVILRSGTGLLAFALFTGFNYGGVLVVYVSSAARIWGVHRVGQVYGWLFSSNIPAALAPLGAGYAFDITGSFLPALTVIAIALILAAGVVFRFQKVIRSDPS